MVTDKIVEEKVWLNKSRYADAEKNYYEKMAQLQKDGEEGSTDNGVQVKNDVSPKKRRKRNSSNKDENVPNRMPPGTKDVPAPPKEKKNNVKEKKNVKFDRKDSDSICEISSSSPVKKIKNTIQTKEPEIISNDDLPWDAIDTQSTTLSQPIENLQSFDSEIQSLNTDIPTQQLSTDDKRKKDKKKNKKAWKTEKINDVALMTSNNMNLDHGNRISQLEKDNRDLKSQVEDLMSVIKKLEARIAALEKGSQKSVSASTTPAKPSPPAKSAPTDDDDDVDLFGSESEEEDEASKKVKEQRLAEYAAKKSKKPVLIAKSNIILDVKPWDDETDMKIMEKSVRDISMDGLIWGASKLVPLAYGIHKLQISCVVEDDKVSVDHLTETIEAIEKFVQSVDIAAFNKV